MNCELMTAIGWQQMWNEGETNIFTNVRTNVSEWKELDDSVNPNVYITGLPKSITTEAFAQFMSKCGII